MFFISRGSVRVFVLSEADDSGRLPPEETYIISLGAGSFFGEISLLDEVVKLDRAVWLGGPAMNAPLSS